MFSLHDKATSKTFSINSSDTVNKGNIPTGKKRSSLLSTGDNTGDSLHVALVEGECGDQYCYRILSTAWGSACVEGEFSEDLPSVQGPD